MMAEIGKPFKLDDVWTHERTFSQKKVASPNTQERVKNRNTETQNPDIESTRKSPARGISVHKTNTTRKKTDGLQNANEKITPQNTFKNQLQRTEKSSLSTQKNTAQKNSSLQSERNSHEEKTKSNPSISAVPHQIFQQEEVETSIEISLEPPTEEMPPSIVQALSPFSTMLFSAYSLKPTTQNNFFSEPPSLIHDDALSEPLPKLISESVESLEEIMPEMVSNDFVSKKKELQNTSFEQDVFFIPQENTAANIAYRILSQSMLPTIKGEVRLDNTIELNQNNISVSKDVKVEANVHVSNSASNLSVQQKFHAIPLSSVPQIFGLYEAEQTTPLPLPNTELQSAKHNFFSLEAPVLTPQNKNAPSLISEETLIQNNKNTTSVDAPPLSFILGESTPKTNFSLGNVDSQGELEHMTFEQLHDQIQAPLEHALKNREKTIEITLDPEGLGRIRIELNFEQKQVRAHFEIKDQSTLQFLKQYEGRIQEILASSGFESEENGMTFSLYQEPQQQSFHEQKSHQHAAQNKDAQPHEKSANFPHAQAPSPLLNKILSSSLYLKNNNGTFSFIA